MFAKPSEDATEAIEATKEPFDFISALAHFTSDVLTLLAHAAFSLTCQGGKYL